MAATVLSGDASLGAAIARKLTGGTSATRAAGEKPGVLDVTITS
jgi:hypothetical protein